MGATASLHYDPGFRPVREEQQHLDALEHLAVNRAVRIDKVNLENAPSHVVAIVVGSMSLSFTEARTRHCRTSVPEAPKPDQALERPLWREATIPSKGATWDMVCHF